MSYTILMSPYPVYNCTYTVSNSGQPLSNQLNIRRIKVPGVSNTTQGTISSSYLFTLYINDCVNSYPNQYVIRFSNNTVVLSLLTSNSNLLSHTAGVDRFAEWCGLNHLMINTKKTEEIIIDPRSIGDHTVISVNSNNISQVSSYKYLGVHIDQDMRWHTHVTSCCAKIHQRLHFLSFHSETKVVWSRYEYYVFLQGEH